MFRDTDPTDARGIERPTLDLEHIESVARNRAAYQSDGVISQYVAPLSFDEVADALLDLLEDDDALAALIPDPLSGEWAGESIPELFDLEVGEEWPDDELLDAYEAAYRETYAHSLEGQVREYLEDEVRSHQSAITDALESEARYLMARAADLDRIPGLEHASAAIETSRAFLDHHAQTLLDPIDWRVAVDLDKYRRAIDNLERYHRRNLD